MTEGNLPNYFVHTLLRARDWQHRPQFDEVCQWWRGGGRGVCALVGMGGAGKTAVAERFLYELQAGNSQRDPPLPEPHSVFVYSFYNDDKPENFFRHLQMWLEGTPRPDTVLAIGPMMFLVQQRQGLIVLDGLEKVQDSGARGGFGKLQSENLRVFLNHIANGAASELSVLVTSRFPLSDLRDSRPRFFRAIAIEEIDVATGVQLLRDRGVHGTDPKLEAVVEECGRHALTVDFAGGYIHEYGSGDPATPLNLGSAEELKAEAEREPDDDKRAVLKQGIRFARIAERYREALLNSDAAALALLERICLFRLGVDCERLATIFTGPDAKKVAGKALASLNADKLQKKLDWLVRMRIVEKSESSSSLKTEDLELKTLYSIHPAVRDGFLSGISRDAARTSHEAVRKGLEVFLGKTPGDNPSDTATLDLLEEIVHHTLQSGHVSEAWDIHRNRVGGFKNLGWRLGAYERGERICRAFTGGETPESIRPLALEREDQGEGKKRIRGRKDEDRIFTNLARKHELPYESLRDHQQTSFINEWALYLMYLGRLAAAARCYELGVAMATRQENWKDATTYNLNLNDVWLMSGRLSGRGNGGLATAAEALRLAELAKLADDDEELQTSYASSGQAHTLVGKVPAALADFRTAHDWQHKRETHATDRPLHSLRGIRHTHLLARLGRREEATRLTKANQELLPSVGRHFYIPKCQLILSTLDTERGEWSSAESLCASSRSWAEARDAKEVLCWSALVMGRIELKRMKAEGGRMNEVELGVADTAIAEGMKIARDCGFGLYHIDLLLERARLHLLRGHASAALDDIELALDKGIPANDETGQPELLAANHEACGYAWAIPAGLQLRAEALMLQAAREVINVRWAVPTDGSLSPINVPAVGTAHPTIGQLIDQAKQCLNEAMDRWQPLHDLEPERPDQNFKLDGKEYNYRATETHQMLVKLAGGLLTRHPLEAPTQKGEDQQRRVDAVAPGESHIGKRIDVLVQVRLPGSPRLSLEDWPLRDKPERIERDSEDAEFHFPRNKQTGELRPATLRVRIVGPDFDVNSESEKLLLVPPFKDSHLVSFLLTPRNRGICRINVELYDLTYVQIGNIFIATAVDSAPRAEHPPLASLQLSVRVEPEQTRQLKEPSQGKKPMTKKHVFVSYCRDNKDDVAQLRNQLIAAGEKIWWDQDILGGQDWKFEIRKAMKEAYAVVVCLSEETADRITSGIYPEVLDAIGAYREHAPGGIFLIPVRLSECEIPPIEIDATRTLDRLQYIDLFSPDGLDQLVKSLQASALHP